jgi:hypothetical protein
MPAFSPWSRQAQEPEPRFAGGPSDASPPPAYPPPPAYAPPGYQPPGYPPTAYQPSPGQSADWVFPPASQQGWPTTPAPRSRRGLWTGATLLIIAVVATLVAVLVSSSTSGSPSSAPGSNQQPNPVPSLVPSPSPTSPTSPANPSNPTSPLPSLGAVATPPGLLAIGYHAYALNLVAPADIALGPAEVAQFKKYGLSRVVGLRALTLGPTAAAGDDYDASINILRFSTPAGAAAELNYSNTQNKKTASTIALPGFATATAFVNKDTTTGISIGAFTTVGRYQVVVILGGLSGNVPTNATVVAAETAKVLRAVLPDAASIQPSPSSGTGSGPTDPQFPTPTPSGTHA